MELNEQKIKIFKEVTEAIGVPGFERNVAKVLEKYYLEHGLEIIRDNLGSIYAYKKSKSVNAPKVMISAHLDEIGFIVKEITKNGAIKGQPLGGFYEQTLLSSRLILVNKDQQKFYGVVGATPPHLLKESDRTKPVQIKDMFFDFGFTSDEEVKKQNIAIGDPIVVEGDFRILNGGKRLLAKAFDNRYGCILGIELLSELINTDLDVDLYIGANVQEEVGLRGAKTASHLINPDFAIVLDCSPANDLSGATQEFGQLGEGVLIRIADGSMVAFPMLIDFQRKICQDINVKYQYYISPGGTDAGEIHKNNYGVLTLTNCICARNIHSNSSIIDMDDYQAAKMVVLEMIKRLNAEKIKDFKRQQQ